MKTLIPNLNTSTLSKWHLFRPSIDHDILQQLERIYSLIYRRNTNFYVHVPLEKYQVDFQIHIN